MYPIHVCTVAFLCILNLRRNNEIDTAVHIKLTKIVTNYSRIKKTGFWLDPVTQGVCINKSEMICKIFLGFWMDPVWMFFWSKFCGNACLFVPVCAWMWTYMWVSQIVANDKFLNIILIRLYVFTTVVVQRQTLCYI